MNRRTVYRAIATRRLRDTSRCVHCNKLAAEISDFGECNRCGEIIAESLQEMAPFFYKPATVVAVPGWRHQ